MTPDVFIFLYLVDASVLPLLLGFVSTRALPQALSLHFLMVHQLIIASLSADRRPTHPSRPTLFPVGVSRLEHSRVTHRSQRQRAVWDEAKQCLVVGRA